jgi:hypothetical protein
VVALCGGVAIEYDPTPTGSQPRTSTVVSSSETPGSPARLRHCINQPFLELFGGGLFGVSKDLVIWNYLAAASARPAAGRSAQSQT